MHKNTVTIKAISAQTHEKLEHILRNADEITLCAPRHGTSRRYFQRFTLPLNVSQRQEAVTNETVFTLSVKKRDYKIADSVAIATERDILKRNGLEIAYWEWTSKQAVVATPEEKKAHWKQSRMRFSPNFE